MTATMYARRRGERLRAGVEGAGDPLCALTDEHALLLEQVAVRVKDLLGETRVCVQALMFWRGLSPARAHGHCLGPPRSARTPPCG